MSNVNDKKIILDSTVNKNMHTRLELSPCYNDGQRRADGEYY